MREFNTAGPVVAADHYLIPPLSRLDLDELLGLVQRKKYFVLHAPRQTGKTSALLALRDLLNGRDEYRCVYATVESGQSAREDVAEGMRVVLAELAFQADLTLGDGSLEGIWPDALERVGPRGALRQALTRWCLAAPKPLVLLIDEIDALIGDTLLSVLRQLRAGYTDRPDRFPHCVILCGVVDVRDYRIRSSAENALVLGGSAPSTSSRSRCGWATSPRRRCGPCSPSTPGRPGRCLPRRRCRRSGRYWSVQRLLGFPIRAVGFVAISARRFPHAGTDRRA